MHLSKIPQRWKRRIGHSPIPRFREAGRRRPNIQVESGSSKPLVRTGTAEPNRLFSLPFSPPPRRFVKRRPVGGAGYSGLTPINATSFLRLREKFLTLRFPSDFPTAIRRQTSKPADNAKLPSHVYGCGAQCGSAQPSPD
jgi:hypothetical protein